MSSLTIPQPGTLEHTKLLWDLLPHPDKSVVWYFARKDARVVGDYARSFAELHTAAQEYSKDGWNVYIQMNPTRKSGGSRASSKDITHWSWVLLDIDPLDEDSNASYALDVYLGKLEEQLGHVLFPHVIHSGRGMQAWLRIEDVELSDAEEVPAKGILLHENKTPQLVRRNVARLTHGFWLKRLQQEVGVVGGCSIDTSVSDLPRVMRMPGTVNQKTGKVAFISRIGELNVGLARQMVEETPEKALHVREISPVEGGRKWEHVMGSVTLTAHDFIHYGVAEPGRHKAVWATLVSLKENGVLQDEARRAVDWGNKVTRPPLSDAEVDRMVKQVYA